MSMEADRTRADLMFTAVKNQLRVSLLSVKYNMMREMVNKVTFVTNIIFMMLNNATILVQWIILFHLREEVGGYTLKEIMLLWGMTAASYGLSHILFARVFFLPELVISGKLDAYLVQPKSVLLGIMTSATDISAIGDFLYGLLVIGIFGHQGRGLYLFPLFLITGTVIFTAFALLMGSLSFWFVRMDMLGRQMMLGMVSFATYPDGIFKGVSRFLLYFIIPVGMAVYHPVHLMIRFDKGMLFTVLGYALLLGTVSVAVFYRGLRRYASSSLMEARM